MPHGMRGGANGFRGGGQVSQLEAKLAEMEKRIDGMRSGRVDCGAATVGGGVAEARRAMRQRGGSREVEPRPGDWRCSHCNAFPCFARARRCYKCGEFKGAVANLSRPQGRSEYLGPIGADGARPMLGGRASPQAAAGNRRDYSGGERSPTTRVPGASRAALAEAERHRSQPGRGAEQRPEAHDCGDGFRPVRNGVAPKAAAASVAAGGGALQANVKATAVRNSWAALSEEDDDDGDHMETDGPAVGGEVGGAGGHDEDDGDAEEGDEDRGDAHGDLDEGALRRAWQGHCHACKLMERNAHDFPARLLDEARALRDAAERQWRAAKQPQPLHKRLRWAEAALREAEGKERAHRQELQEHLAAAEQRTKEIEGRIAVDAARTARRRAALDALRFEAAPRALPSSERAARVAVSGITSDVGPQLAAIIERMATPLGDDAESIRQELQLVAVSVSRVEGVLREGTEADARSGCTAHFDISDTSANGPADGGGDGPPGDDHGGRDGKDNVTRTAAQPLTRWARQAEHGVWKKDGGNNATSGAAVDEARRMLQGKLVGTPTVGSPSATGAPAGPGLEAANTNDLAEAERRSRHMAQQQLLALQQRQQAPKDEQQQLQEDVQRQQRLHSQQEELRKHQAAMQQAAQARAAEEDRQREALIASMSPQELARAAELHAQQAAIGAQVFGTQTASQLADMVHQAERQRAEQAEVEQLMGTSQEDFIAQQSGNTGACPW